MTCPAMPPPAGVKKCHSSRSPSEVSKFRGRSGSVKLGYIWCIFGLDDKWKTWRNTSFLRFSVFDLSLFGLRDQNRNTKLVNKCE